MIQHKHIWNEETCCTELWLWSSFRWVFIWWLNQNWLVYLLLVHHTCIWGTTTWAPQCNYHQAAFSSHWMACASQIKVPHWTYNTLPQVYYNSPWKPTLWVQEHNMFCIPNMWASERSGCTGSTSGSEASEGICHSISTSNAEQDTAKDCFV